MYHIAEAPDGETVADLFETARYRQETVLLFARCRVDYEGRAATELAAGDRVVIVKPDGTVLVHTDEQRTPQNWQPPGATVTVTSTDPLRVRAERSNPDEIIDIECETVFFAARLQMADDATLELVGSESDLRERIFAEPALVEDGFRPKSREKETPAGPVDVWGHDADGRPVILELKRRRVGPDAVTQLRRYVETVGADARGILVAPSVTDRGEALLAEYDLEFRALEPRGEPAVGNHGLDDFLG